MDDFWTWFTVLVGGGSVVLAIGATILGVLCTIVPFVLIGWFIWSRVKQRDAVRQSALAWSSTTGRVTLSRVEVHDSGESTSVVPVIVYAYDVGGRAYQSKQIRAGDNIMRMTSSTDAYALVDRYPAGAIVPVFYNPANPSESALER